MRLTRPAHVSLIDPAAHPLPLRGERLQISVLDHDLIRVQHWPDGAPRLDRTWMIVGPGGDAPHEGRRRDDLTPFSLPPFDLDVGEGRAQLRTGALQVEIALGDL